MLSIPDFKEKSIVICFASEGQKVSFKNDNLIIQDNEENIIIQTTCYRIFALWIIGNITVTSGILERSKKFGFPIQMLSHNYRPYGIWNNATEGNVLLRKKQYLYNDTTIARHIVFNKITNQIELLKSIRDKSDELINVIDLMKKYAEQIQPANNIQTLLGLEGVSTRLYFKHWFEGMNWNGRKPRTKVDIINTTLDIGYTYLFNIIEAMLNLYGFDLYQGVYHKCFYQRKSLVCDLVEPFRCMIDKQIKRAHGLKQLQTNDFIEQKGRYFLKREKNKDYTHWLMEPLLLHKEDIFKYIQQYYRAFIRNKPIEEYPTFNMKNK